MTRPAGYRYTGIFLSELVEAGRYAVTIACERCAHSRTISLSDLIAEHGDVVMPDALGRVTVACPSGTKSAPVPDSAWPSTEIPRRLEAMASDAGHVGLATDVAMRPVKVERCGAMAPTTFLKRSVGDATGAMGVHHRLATTRCVIATPDVSPARSSDLGA